jgi:hypothetical protein
MQILSVAHSQSLSQRSMQTDTDDGQEQPLYEPVFPYTSYPFPSLSPHAPVDRPFDDIIDGGYYKSPFSSPYASSASPSPFSPPLPVITPDRLPSPDALDCFAPPWHSLEDETLIIDFAKQSTPPRPTSSRSSSGSKGDCKRHVKTDAAEPRSTKGRARMRTSKQMMQKERGRAQQQRAVFGEVGNVANSRRQIAPTAS